MRDPADLRTLETTDLVPVDLNSLLYDLERTIAALRSFRGRPGDGEVAERFRRAAAERRRALLAAAWDPDRRFLYDVRWRTGRRVADRPTMAAAAALYFGVPGPERGRAVAATLARDFLRPGGFVTTRIRSGQQWDAPNGWPPLQWMAIRGLRRYGLDGPADTAAARWLELVRRTYRRTGRMMEKYDVVDLSRPAGGGEYPTQDGFGWTNGVTLRLLAERAAAPGAGRGRVVARPDLQEISDRALARRWGVAELARRPAVNRETGGSNPPAPAPARHRHRRERFTPRAVSSSSPSSSLPAALTRSPPRSRLPAPRSPSSPSRTPRSTSPGGGPRAPRRRSG